MRGLILSLLVATGGFALNPMPGWMHPGGPLGPGGVVTDGCDAACQAAIAESLAVNGIGDSASVPLNAKALLWYGGGVQFVKIGNSLCYKNPGDPAYGNWTDTVTAWWRASSLNLCVGGAVVEGADINGVAMAQGPAAYKLYNLETDGNNVTDLDPVNNYINAFSGLPYYLAVPNYKKSYANTTAAVTTSGTWTDDTHYGLPFKWADASGEWIQFKVPASKWLVLGQLFGESGGAYTVTVNGVSQGTFSNKADTAAAATAYSARQFGPFSGSDSLTVRITNAENGTRTYLAWWWTVQEGEAVEWSKIVQHGNVLRPAYDSTKDALSLQYANAKDSLFLEMLKMGADVAWIKGPISNIPDSCFNADQIHLAGCGAYGVADTMMPLFVNGRAAQAWNQALAAPALEIEQGATGNRAGVMKGDRYGSLKVWGEYNGGTDAAACIEYAVGLPSATLGPTGGAWYACLDATTKKYIIGRRSSAGWGAPADGDKFTIDSTGKVTAVGPGLFTDSLKVSTTGTTSGRIIISSEAGASVRLSSEKDGGTSSVVSIGFSVGAFLNGNPQGNFYAGVNPGNQKKFSIGYRSTSWAGPGDADFVILDTVGNMILGANSAGASAVKVLALSNTATAPSTSVDLAQLYGANDAGGGAILGVWQETAPAADVGIASTHSALVRWNGVVYKIPLVVVP